MQPLAPWRPMHTAPQTIDRIWLNHLTLGPILAEGRPGRWYAPSAAHQVWRWYRSVETSAIVPFSGWLPFEAVAGTALPARPAADTGLIHPGVIRTESTSEDLTTTRA